MLTKKSLFTCLLLSSLFFNAIPSGSAESLVNEGANVGNSIEIHPYNSYESRNQRRTNYKIKSGWYYGYTVTIGPSTPIGSISRTYDVYYRDVSFTVEYDIYDKYLDRYVRTDRYNMNSREEQWRLKY